MDLTFSSLAGSEFVAAEMNSLCSANKVWPLIDRISHKKGLSTKHLPFIDDATALSPGKSNTQRNFESINWSGVTSFHYRNKFKNLFFKRKSNAINK